MRLHHYMYMQFANFHGSYLGIRVECDNGGDEIIEGPDGGAPSGAVKTRSLLGQSAHPRLPVFTLSSVDEGGTGAFHGTAQLLLSQ